MEGSPSKQKLILLPKEKLLISNIYSITAFTNGSTQTTAENQKTLVKKKKIKAKQEKQKIRKKSCTNQPMLFQEIHNLKTSAPLTEDELVSS